MMLTERDIERELRTRVGPVLSDGTTLRDVIDFDRHEVAMRAINDPEIHRLELDRIFTRMWMFVGHELEIPNPGDYILRNVGEDPVIVTRNADGEVNVLLNICSHRGMQVCWADRGNESSFKCRYHGWVFNNDGELLGAPMEQMVYGDLDKPSLGLVQAKVGIRHGVIFASFDPVVPTLEDYLGDLVPYFDAVHNWEGSGIEWEWWPFVGRTVQPGNWKLLADQNSGDGYHVFTQHLAMFELFASSFMTDDRSGQATDMTNLSTVSFPEGHSSSTFTFASNSPKPSASAANPLAGRVGGYTMFPNHSATIDFSAANTGPSPVATFSVNHVQPHGPAHMEVWAMGLVDKSASDEEKAKLRRATNQTVSIGAVDDQLSWVSLAQMAQGSMGRRQPLRYFNRVGSGPTPEGWPVSGGEFHTGRVSPDDGQWNFWMAWFNALTADEA